MNKIFYKSRDTMLFLDISFCLLYNLPSVYSFDDVVLVFFLCVCGNNGSYLTIAELRCRGHCFTLIGVSGVLVNDYGTFKNGSQRVFKKLFGFTTPMFMMVDEKSFIPKRADKNSLQALLRLLNQLDCSERWQPHGMSHGPA